MKHNDIFEVLRNVKLFKAVPLDVLSNMAEISDYCLYEDNYTIFNKGDYGDFLYIIALGNVLVHDGEHQITTLKKYQTFGEHALLTPSPRSASVTTVGQCEILRISRENFYTILSISPEVFQSLINLILDRLHERNEILIENLKNREKVLMELVDERTNLLQSKNDELEYAYSQIKDSINYAAYLQAQVLGDAKEIRRILKQDGIADSFIYFKPKDTISGDFYWFDNPEKGIYIIAAADCTGHGVPGALMTMLGNMIFNDIVKNQKIFQPNEILCKLEAKLYDTLHQKAENLTSNDGMDVAIVLIDKNNNTISYSGAKNPLIILENKELSEVKGSNFAIGGKRNIGIKSFELHCQQISSGMNIYIFSDGYQDQFNADTNRKFMKKNFRNLLLSCSDLSNDEQLELIEITMNDWKKDNSQNDDILIVGLKFH